MKKLLWIAFLLLALTGVLAACGGGGQTPAEAVDASEVPVVSAEEEAAAEAPAAEDSAAEQPAAENTAADEPAADAPAAEAPAAEAGGDMVAGRPASGADPDTGLEINPPTVVPGVDFIVRGEIVNANLTPQDSPEFVIISPSGTRFRIRSQPVPDIAYEDGTVPALHEFQRGVLVQATVRQEEDAGATITVHSTDLTLLHDQ